MGIQLTSQVAWPAGNSGVVAFFRPQNGVNGTLAIQLVDDGTGAPLRPIYEPAAADSRSGQPMVGVSGRFSLSSPAELSLAILGSVRTMRDFIEGPSLLAPEIQDAVKYTVDENRVVLSRLWLDNTTTTTFSFEPLHAPAQIVVRDQLLTFAAGTYRFRAAFDYPHSQRLSAQQALAPHAHGLIASAPDETRALSFFSYPDKLLAGGWRFLTYFGRDSMIAALLLDSILSEGKAGALEAVIASVLERLDPDSGTVAHEESLGDYASFLNLRDGLVSAEPHYDYDMVDTDFFLPIVGDFSVRLFGSN